MPMQPSPISETSRSPSFRLFISCQAFRGRGRYARVLREEQPVLCLQLEVAGGLLEAGLYGLAVSLEQRQPLVVGVVSPIQQIRIPPNLANGHPGGPELGEELDPLQVLVRVAAMAASIACDRLQQPCALPEPQSVRADAGLGGGVRDGEGRVHPFDDRT